jgi:hypothetical protein
VKPSTSDAAALCEILLEVTPANTPAERAKFKAFKDFLSVQSGVTLDAKGRAVADLFTRTNNGGR